MRCPCAAALLVVLASACGSSGASSGHVPTVVTGQQRVDRMALADGDLPGYHVQSTGAEVLADQLPPPTLPRAALVRRLVTANWIASDHSTLVASVRTAPAVFSDANLFKSASATRRILALEFARVPGVSTRYLAVPPGAPAGARYYHYRQGTRAFFELSWQEGPVLGLVLTPESPGAHLSAGALTRIADTLGRAAKAESIRIAGAANASSATV